MTTGTTMRETFRQIRTIFNDGPSSGLSDSALLRRFAEGRDESAFEALVARHGPTVLGACRGVLRDTSEAEDVFQATFLALAKSARSIRVEDSLGGWLHRVARRTAGKANARAFRRRSREAPGVEPDRVPVRDEPGRAERVEGLHEEIDRLSDSLRRPLILCALEGLTHAEAADRLGVGEATVRRRLADAKERLRARLERRGLTLPSGFAWVFSQAVPLSLVAATVRVALVGASGGAVSAKVAGLATAAGWGRRVVLGLLGVGIAAGMVGAFARRPAEEAENPAPPPAPLVAPAQEPAAAKKPEGRDNYTPTTDFPGVVLDPEGRPFAGASVFARSYGEDAAVVSTASDAAGRYRVRFAPEASMTPRSFVDDRLDGKPWPEFETTIEEWPSLVATAPGFGFGVPALAEDGSNVVRLVADVPIEGRVLDLEGRPIAGATARVRGVLAAVNGDLTPWVDAARAAIDRSDYDRTTYKHLSLIGRHRDGLAHAYPALTLSATTGADGRFRIDGVGRERVAWVAIEKPGIESRLVAVATRPGLAPFVVPSEVSKMRKMISNPSEDLAVVGPRFDHVAGPGRAIEGTVVDSKALAPIAGATVDVDLTSIVEWSEETRFRAVTDANGHYRIEGLPEGIERKVSVTVPVDRPHIGLERSVQVGRNPAPGVVANFEMKRGIWVSGRVLDGSTGQAIRDARVYYRVFRDNPHLPKRPDSIAFDNNGISTDDEGRFRLAVLPGRGLLSVWAGRGKFIHGAGSERIPGQVEEYGWKGYPTVPDRVYPDNVHLVAEVNPAEGAKDIALDLALLKGKAREGRAIGPDGPIVGKVRAGGVEPEPWLREVEATEIKVENLAPGEVRRVVVRVDDRKLIGVATLKPEDGDGPFEVKLVPWATLGGRVVDADGKPRTQGVSVSLRDDDKLPKYLLGLENSSQWPSPKPVEADGRFHLDALIPGEPYQVQVDIGDRIARTAAKGMVLKPGESKDLGDVLVEKKP